MLSTWAGESFFLNFLQKKTISANFFFFFLANRTYKLLPEIEMIIWRNSQHDLIENN